MKRLILICEGPTEVEFCKTILVKHFISKEIVLQTPLIKKSGGGIIPWAGLKKQIENHLMQEKDVIVTTLIDYYGIQPKFKFPNWEEAHKLSDKDDRLTMIETAMKESVSESISSRFIPYVQLHEFEGLLFNNINSFIAQFDDEEFINKSELEVTIEKYPNPELINDTPNNAPSYRLQRLIKGYNKIVHGSILAEEIGLSNIRSKSPRFNNWISLLENI